MPAEPDKNNLVLTAKEVCQLLKIPLSTLYGLTKSGKIKGIKIGKHWRYLTADILFLLYGPSRKAEEAIEGYVA